MLTQDYLSIPRRLIIELGDNPLALALYCWIARLYLVVQAPVPLSRADVQKFDPSTKPGAIKRAFDRLVNEGWLLETAGYKSCYTPVWGWHCRSGAPLPWKIGAEALGCPRRISVEATRIDRAILDVYMGRFQPHKRNSHLESYFTTPLLRLVDIGMYILVAAGLAAEDTTQLQRWGLVSDGEIQAIPDDEVVVALASQRASIEGFQLTEQGWRKLGWGRTRARAQQQETPPRVAPAPLIFVSKDRIGTLIPHLIGDLIGCAASGEGTASASERAKSASSAPPPTIRGTQRDSQNSRESPPNPPTRTQHGGGAITSNEQSNRGIELPDSEAARVLFSFGVNDPNCLVELSTTQIEQVGGAIAYAESEDLGPGWVVSALRRHRDEGWPLPRVRSRRRAECIDVQETLSGKYGALFRLGSDLSDLDCSSTDPEPEQADDQSSEQGPTPSFVLPCAGADSQGAARSPSEPAPGGNDQADELAPANIQLEEEVVSTAEGTPLVRLWEQVQELMRMRTTRDEFNTWIRCTALLSIANGVATIGAPSAFLKEGFELRYSGAVRDAIGELYVPVRQVRVVITGAGSRATRAMSSSA